MIFRIASGSLLQHRRRTLLLGGALALVTSVLVILLGVANGIQSTLLESATTLITGHVTVGGFYKVTAGRTSPVLANQAEIEAVVRENVPELAFLADRGRGWGRLIGPSRSIQLAIGGVNIAREDGLKRNLTILSGSIADLAQPNTIMLYENHARRLGVEVGDPLVLSASTVRNTYNTVDVRVVAIARDTGVLSRFMVFVPIEALRALYQLGPDTTGALLLYLNDPAAAGEVKARLRRVLEARGVRLMADDGIAFHAKGEVANREGWTGQKLDVTTWESEVKDFKDMLFILRSLCVLLVGVLLLIVLTGITNTLWISIRERTSEIGTLRAIGMGRGQALRMILTEGALLGFCGAGAGAILGSLLSAGLNAMQLPIPESLQLVLMRSTLSLQPQLSTLVTVVLGVGLFTAAASLLPAFLAARLRPITAIHHVG